MTRRHRHALTIGLAAGIAALVASGAAHAGAYPTSACVGKKLGVAAKKCAADLKAWSSWANTQDTTKRDAALQKNQEKFAASWAKAEAGAAKKSTECVETTGTPAEVDAIVDAGVADVVNAITTGVTLPSKCAAGLIKSASSYCQAMLQAEGKHIQSLVKDPTGAGRTEKQGTALSKFNGSFAKNLPCAGTSATPAGVQGEVDQLSSEIVYNSITSPQVAQNTWTEIAYTAGEIVEYEGKDFRPICSRSTPYSFFVRRGNSNKLLMYYQGGGACWDSLTCSDAAGAFDDEVTAADNPGNQGAGFADYDNPNNPFADYNVVFVSYCTGDVHWGQNAPNYGNPTNQINHVGYINAKVAEKWAREHFPNPESVFVTGSSAGAYGAALHGTLLHEVFPSSHFDVLGDAGNGVITQDFLEDSIEQQWRIVQNLPRYIPALDIVSITQLSIVDLWAEAALYYQSRGSRYAQYTTAYDGGGGGQTFFYSVMVSGIPAGLSWWNQSCAWNDIMVDYADETIARAPNYRSYIGSGSRHTMFGTDRVYTDTTGGVPTVRDWVQAMIDNTGGWTNVTASNFGLLLKGQCSAGSSNPGDPCHYDSECPGGSCQGEDPKPDPLQSPFTLNGSDVEIVCP